LETFAGREDFLYLSEQAFGNNVSSDGARAVIQDLASGEAIPDINIVSADELNHANGGLEIIAPACKRPFISLTPRKSNE
jgi:hypothetical protein